MTRGKASRNVPPAATSQTSCQLHSGPIAATTSRRSAPVLRHDQVQRARADVPAVEHDEHGQHEAEEAEPQLNHGPPPRATGSPYGRGGRLTRRAVQDFAADQKQVQQAEHEVESGQPDQREQHVAGADHVADSRRWVRNRP